MTYTEAEDVIINTGRGDARLLLYNVIFTKGAFSFDSAFLFTALTTTASSPHLVPGDERSRKADVSVGELCRLHAAKFFMRICRSATEIGEQHSFKYCLSDSSRTY